MERETDNRISYIRKPLAQNSLPCLLLAAAAWLLGAGGMGLSVHNQGVTPLGGVAMCFSSLLFSVAALLYGRRALREEEKNYILARIGTAAAGILAILWLVMIMIGFRG